MVKQLNAWTIAQNLLYQAHHLKKTVCWFEELNSSLASYATLCRNAVQVKYAPAERNEKAVIMNSPEGNWL